MDLIRESFNNVKKDIDNIKLETSNLKKNISEIKNLMGEMGKIMCVLEEKIEQNISTHPLKNKTFEQNISTHNYALKPLNHQNLVFSTGNEGVSTDRQTDTSTDRQAEKKEINQISSQDSFEEAIQALNSLDSVKKQIRLKFKRITEQELLVFSTIYQLEEEKGYANYKLISEKLNLTESSVRDHVGNLIKKGIPVDKQKINNKSISLFISPNLKKVASLSTILKLRDI